VNGTRYYFAVTAYNFNPTLGITPSTLETPLSIISVTPQSPSPGTRFAAHHGDTVGNVVHVTAPGLVPSDGVVTAVVVNPARCTGHNYSVAFDTSRSTVTWKLKDMTIGTQLIANQTNQSGNDYYPFADGLQVIVTGPGGGMKSWSIPSGTRRFSPVGGGRFGLEGFSTGHDPDAPQNRDFGTIGMGVNFEFSGIATSLELPGYHTVLLKLAAVDSSTLWDPNIPPSDPNFSRSYRYVRRSEFPPAKPEFGPWIRNTSGSIAYQDFVYGVPFSAWDMDVNPPLRLAVGHMENNAAGGHLDGRYWPDTTDVDNSDSTGPMEFCFIFASAYASTPDPSFMTHLANSRLPLMWVMTCTRPGNDSWSAGDEFRVVANHVNWPGNTFSFTSPSNTVGDKAIARADVSLLNVFPNPYYGVNPAELSKYSRFVTFSHLPRKAIIRIFNVGGVMVRRIDRDNQSQFEQWDLKNDAGLPVGSGMYFAYIEMPDLGVTKVLKLAIVQETQILN
jgi:hypothetical protein